MGIKEKQFDQSLAEEIANSVTHGIGAGLSVAALSILVTLAGLYGDAWRVVSFSIYGSTLILLYLASTLYHGFTNLKLKRVFNVLDHSAIFLLIAGTYTPITLVTLRGPWGWSLFGVIWGLALVGIVYKVLVFGKSRWVSVALYLAMGWMCLIAIKPMVDSLSTGGLMWIAIGGACYSFGVIFYLWKKLPFHHTIWHLFVLGGSISHFFAILFHVLPMETGA